MFRSVNPALKVPRQDEDVAVNMVYLDTPAVDNGLTIATNFVGTTSGMTDAYGDDTLEDNV